MQKVCSAKSAKCPSWFGNKLGMERRVKSRVVFPLSLSNCSIRFQRWTFCTAKNANLSAAVAAGFVVFPFIFLSFSLCVHNACSLFLRKDIYNSIHTTFRPQSKDLNLKVMSNGEMLYYAKILKVRPNNSALLFFCLFQTINPQTQ